MKVLNVVLASLGLASAATVTKKVSYDDWKVYRVTVGANAAKLTKVMNKLQLETWKGKVATSDVVDVVVPPSQVADFEASTGEIDTHIMHENLGLSIADEETFSIYAGTLPHNHKQSMIDANVPCQLVLLQTKLGSTRTMRLPTISSGSQIWQLRTQTTLK